MNIMTKGSSWSCFTPLIFLREQDIPLCSSQLWGWHPMYAIYLPLVWLIEGFEWPSCGRSPCDRLYFPYGALWAKGHVVFIPLDSLVFVLIIIPEPARISFFSQISTISLFKWAPLSAPSGPCSPLCNDRDPYENGNTSSSRACLVTNVVAKAIWGSAYL